MLFATSLITSRKVLLYVCIVCEEKSYFLTEKILPAGHHVPHNLPKKRFSGNLSDNEKKATFYGGKWGGRGVGMRDFFNQNWNKKIFQKFRNRT